MTLNPIGASESSGEISMSRMITCGGAKHRAPEELKPLYNWRESLQYKIYDLNGSENYAEFEDAWYQMISAQTMPENSDNSQFKLGFFRETKSSLSHYWKALSAEN